MCLCGSYLFLFTLRITAIAARVAARNVLELTAALRTLADHARHSGGLRFGYLALLDRAKRLRHSFQTSVDKEQALGDRLLGRCQQTFVKPNRVRARDLVQAVRDLVRLESAA